jgi:acyl-coenzyme A thioesterase PaaI-like protein
MTDDILRRQTVLPDAPAAAASLIEPLLAEVAGAGAEPVSITLDYGPVSAAGTAVTVEAQVERATRTLVFAHGRLVSSEGQVLAAGSAVFRKPASIIKAG